MSASSLRIMHLTLKRNVKEHIVGDTRLVSSFLATKPHEEFSLVTCSMFILTFARPSFHDDEIKSVYTKRTGSDEKGTRGKKEKIEEKRANILLCFFFASLCFRDDAHGREYPERDAE